MRLSLIVAAAASGSGKTLVTLALLRHFRNQGRRVGSFKVGPDYIDPAFHTAATGRACINLDGWAMRPETLTVAYAAAADDVEFVIGEGVMGLFDGALNGSASTADLAVRLGVPIVLVVDVTGQAASAAAVVHGFNSYRDTVDVAGVIFNRVGSPLHAQILRDACRDLDVPVLGFLPRDADFSMPKRYLGLVQASERDDLDDFLERAAAFVAEHVDVRRLQGLAQRAAMFHPAAAPPPIDPLGQRIAVADDIAFSFAYPLTIEGWRRAGAEILPSWTGCAMPRRRAGRWSANAAAIWCWARPSSTPRARATPWPACCRWRPRFRMRACISATARRRCLRTDRSGRPVR